MPLRRAIIGIILLAANLTLGSLHCTSQSQPNPIAATYPSDATGTLNGTVTILPILYSLARSIIPAEYPILENAYRSLLPDFPADHYPVLLQLNIDHGVQEFGIKVPDFNQAKFLFPFVDRLKDGYTTMMYGKHGLITADNLVAILGAAAYGFDITPGKFDPPCDAYACVQGSLGCRQKYYNSYAALDLSHHTPAISINFTQVPNDESPYPYSFFKNVTNQPQFSSVKLYCDHFTRLFNSSVTAAPYEPQVIRVNASATTPYFPVTSSWVNAYGLAIDTAFIEHNMVSCESLQGYEFTG